MLTETPESTAGFFSVSVFEDDIGGSEAFSWCHPFVIRIIRLFCHNGAGGIARKVGSFSGFQQRRE
jgi:hypothetical protein